MGTQFTHYPVRNGHRRVGGREEILKCYSCHFLPFGTKNELQQYILFSVKRSCHSTTEMKALLCQACHKTMTDQESVHFNYDQSNNFVWRGPKTSIKFMSNPYRLNDLIHGLQLSHFNVTEGWIIQTGSKAWL